MEHIPWERVLAAIRVRDGAGLRLMAEQARCNQRRELLLVFAGIVESGMPIVESRPAIRITTQRVRAKLQTRFPAISRNARVLVLPRRSATKK